MMNHYNACHIEFAEHIDLTDSRTDSATQYLEKLFGAQELYFGKIFNRRKQWEYIDFYRHKS